LSQIVNFVMKKKQKEAELQQRVEVVGERVCPE
jgi:hypothetical protein